MTCRSNFDVKYEISTQNYISTATRRFRHKTLVDQCIQLRLIRQVIYNFGLFARSYTGQQKWTFYLWLGCVIYCSKERFLVSTNSLAAAIVHVRLVRKWRELVSWVCHLFFAYLFNRSLLRAFINLCYHNCGPFAYEESSGDVRFGRGWKNILNFWKSIISTPS